MTGHTLHRSSLPLRRSPPGVGPALLLLLSLLLPLGVLLPGTVGAQTAVQPAIGPLVVDGQAQVVEAFADPAGWIRERLWVETEVDSDGDGLPDRVHVTVVRPEQTETEGMRVPVIYETSPYYAGTARVDQILWDVRHELGEEPPSRGPQPQVPHQGDREWISNSHVDTWVPRGFAVVHSDAPGTGLSHGCPTMGGINESLAPKAVIDWLNGRARGFTTADGDQEVFARWSTGRVGMTGTSFNGTLPLAAATTGVEGLEAIIPIAPNTSYWHYYRSHGLVRSPGGYLGEDIDGLYDFVYSGRPERRDYCNTVVRQETLLANMDRITGNWSDFWAERDYALHLDSLRAAVLMAHAWNDWNVMPEHSVRIIEGIQARGTPLQVYFHQGGHGGAPPLEMMNRWFTRYLLDVENGVEDEPRAWIVREGDDPMNPTPYPDYPHPRAAPVVLVPGPGGTAAGPLSPVAGGSATPLSGVREADHLETLVDDVSFSGADLARAELSPHRLLYRTTELQSPLHLSGTPEISLRLAADRPAVNLSVWLVALPWEASPGQQPNFSVITRGWADPQNHRSLIESDPLVPGQFRDLTFTLQPTDQVIPPGKRVALVVFSSDQEFTLWPEPGAELTLDLSGVELVLPVVGGTAALQRALSP
ncbi:MAG: Xaa-Pro dipeptidyl-peptidase [Gemmatimonadales bacterium]|nr:MAG: Xaa-Pro dipeptidyl-peptidase [Gemmatimonadales bacterium]